MELLPRVSMFRVQSVRIPIHSILSIVRIARCAFLAEFADKELLIYNVWAHVCVLFSCNYNLIAFTFAHIISTSSM